MDRFLPVKAAIIFVFVSVLISLSSETVRAQDAFLGGPVDIRSLPREYRRQFESQRELPSYMPRPHSSWEGKKVRGKVVRQNSSPVGHTGYAIGRPPPKSISKQFHPRPRNRSSGFGSVGMF